MSETPARRTLLGWCLQCGRITMIVARFRPRDELPAGDCAWCRKGV